MLHKWKKIKSTMATTQYECDNCLEFSEIFEEEGIITFPPINGCSFKKHNWELINYNMYTSKFLCTKCSLYHNSFEDDPKTWVENITSECK